MKLKTGIVGLPNVGKSTLFNALTEQQAAQAENYPFCTIEPNIGIVAVPDTRYEILLRVSAGLFLYYNLILQIRYTWKNKCFKKIPQIHKLWKNLIILKINFHKHHCKNYSILLLCPNPLLVNLPKHMDLYSHVKILEDLHVSKPTVIVSRTYLDTF